MMGEILHDLKELISRLFESPTVTAIGSVLLGLLHQLFGETFRPVHSAVLILILADWAFGLSHAVMARELSSNKSLGGVLELTLYGGIFIVGAQLEKVQLIGPFLNGSLAGVMVITEAVSVLENIDKLARLKGVELDWLESVIELLEQRKTKLSQEAGRDTYDQQR